MILWVGALSAKANMLPWVDSLVVLDFCCCSNCCHCQIPVWKKGVCESWATKEGTVQDRTSWFSAFVVHLVFSIFQTPV